MSKEKEVELDEKAVEELFDAIDSVNWLNSPPMRLERDQFGHITLVLDSAYTRH